MSFDNLILKNFNILKNKNKNKKSRSCY